MVYEHDNDGTLTLVEGNIIPAFKKLLKEHNPQMIVELGTYLGGTVKYFSEWLPYAQIYTIDAFWMVSKEDAKLFRENNVTVIITGDMMSNNLLVPTLLSMPVKKFLFCDNGIKDLEIRNFAGYLRPGDLLGCHDWHMDCKELHNLSFDNFREHSFNKEYSYDGVSALRFWYRKEYDRNIKIPDQGARL